MSEIVFTSDYRGYRIEVWLDEYGLDPRTEADQLGTLLCWHRRYTLGDDKAAAGVPSDPVEASIWLEEEGEKLVWLPVYMFEHSGVALQTTPFSGPHAAWDSGQVGFIYVHKDKLAAEGIDEATAALILENEVKTYSKYINGEVYGWRIVRLDDTLPEIDTSVGGYYDLGHLKTDAANEIDATLD